MIAARGPRRGGADPRDPADRLSTRVGKLTGAAPLPTELRDYGIGAQILLDLGVHDMVLLSNTQRTIVGLEGYGLTVVEQRPIEDVAG